jgi:hypothetical protein
MSKCMQTAVQSLSPDLRRCSVSNLALQCQLYQQEFKDTFLSTKPLWRQSKDEASVQAGKRRCTYSKERAVCLAASITKQSEHFRGNGKKVVADGKLLGGILGNLELKDCSLSLAPLGLNDTSKDRPTVRRTVPAVTAVDF